jgi:hypothetical protein
MRSSHLKISHVYNALFENKDTGRTLLIKIIKFFTYQCTHTYSYPLQFS